MMGLRNWHLVSQDVLGIVLIILGVLLLILLLLLFVLYIVEKKLARLQSPRSRTNNKSDPFTDYWTTVRGVLKRVIRWILRIITVGGIL